MALANKETAKWRKNIARLSLKLCNLGLPA